jgi:hypothetical protein
VALITGCLLVRELKPNYSTPNVSDSGEDDNGDETEEE